MPEPGAPPVSVIRSVASQPEIVPRLESVIVRHNDDFRRAIESCGGREIKTTGDGFLVRLDVPVRTSPAPGDALVR